MKPEDKLLLLQDLSARLPYKVCINDRGTPHRLVNICWDGIKFVVNCSPFGTGHGHMGTPLFDGDICYIKPYLRPMSSMTEEEKKEYQSLCEIHFDNDADANFMVYYFDTFESFDWLNKNMFDYRDLIPKNLAIEVTEDNNPYKK